MRARDYIAVGVAVLLALPILFNPVSWPVAAALVVAWIAVFYGSGYVLELEKNRRFGERGMGSEVRNKLGGDDEP